jgi:hypothetical protein
LSTVDKREYVKMSFMIFRTGSVLIVGKCSDSVLMTIYKFLKKLLETEYDNVGISLVEREISSSSTKNKKLRKKTVVFSSESSLL